jgi:hypothetical protein
MSSYMSKLLPAEHQIFRAFRHPEFHHGLQDDESEKYNAQSVYLLLSGCELIDVTGRSGDL